MEGSIRFPTISIPQKVVEGLNTINELTTAIKRLETQNLITSKPDTFVARVNNQLRELAAELNSAQNTITKNQILLSALGRIRAILTMLPHSDRNQIILQINNIITNAVFNNEQVLKDAPSSLELFDRYIDERTKIANEEINWQIANIKKINISYENILATNINYNIENFNSVVDFLTKFKKELAQSNPVLNLQTTAVQKLL